MKSSWRHAVSSCFCFLQLETNGLAESRCWETSCFVAVAWRQQVLWEVTTSGILICRTLSSRNYCLITSSSRPGSCSLLCAPSPTPPALLNRIIYRIPPECNLFCSHETFTHGSESTSHGYSQTSKNLLGWCQWNVSLSSVVKNIYI